MLCVIENAIKVLVLHNMDGLYSNFATDKVVISY